MSYETRTKIADIIATFILIVIVIGFIYLITIFLNNFWKRTCESRWWDKGKYVGLLWWCLVKTKQGYIPEDRLYNLNSLENSWK